MSGLYECEQIFVNLVLHRRAQSMRSALVHLELRIRDEFRLQCAGLGERHNFIIVTVLTPYPRKSQPASVGVTLPADEFRP